MILFIDEYITVFRRKQKRCLRRNWHFYECVYRWGWWGPDEDMLTPDSPVEDTSGSSKPVKPDLTPGVHLCS